MTPLALEAWILKVVDRVASRANAEDARVELKRDWPKPVQAARILAAHSNAALGVPILWIIGLDEHEGIVGADFQELSNWYPSVCSHFDGTAPSLQEQVVTVSGKTLVAMRFETDRAPYVVKNPVYGSPGGGRVEREVPWREGTRTMTARREHLVRMLSPMAIVPEAELLSSTLYARMEAQVGGEPLCRWYLRGSLYVNAPSGVQTVFPRHKYKVSVTQGAQTRLQGWSPLRVFPSGTISAAGSRIDSHTISSTSSEAIATGPGQMNFECSAAGLLGALCSDVQVVVVLSLGVVGSPTPMAMTILLEPARAESDQALAWSARVAA